MSVDNSTDYELVTCRELLDHIHRSSTAQEALARAVAKLADEGEKREIAAHARLKEYHAVEKERLQAAEKRQKFNEWFQKAVILVLMGALGLSTAGLV